MPYRNILVPFDGSPLAKAAEAWALRLLGTAPGELDMVRVVPPLEVLMTPRPTPTMLRLEAREHAAAMAAAKAAMARRAGRLRRSGTQITGLVASGLPAACILEQAALHHTDLIVMGTHGRSGLVRAVLSSVADEVSRNAPCSVLLLPSPGHPSADAFHLLVALDGSELSEAALAAGLEFADTVPSRLTILHVETGDASGLSGVAELPAEAYLDSVGARIRQRGYDAVAIVQKGQPVETILSVAATRQADVIVVASHGRSGLARVLLGSVASAIISAAATPVLLARWSPAAMSLRPAEVPER